MATEVEAVVATEVEALPAVLAEEAAAGAVAGVGVAPLTSSTRCRRPSAASPRTSPCGTRNPTSARVAVGQGIAQMFAVLS